MKERKVRHIMSKYKFRPKRNIPVDELRNVNLAILLGKRYNPLQIFVGLNPKSKEHSEILKVYEYYYALGKSDNDIMEIWIQTMYEKNQRRQNFDFMPKTSRDNLNPKTNTINFKGGGYNRSKIRVPSKKHKSRFKNFMNLFPEYCERNNISL